MEGELNGREGSLWLSLCEVRADCHLKSWKKRLPAAAFWSLQRGPVVVSET